MTRIAFNVSGVIDADEDAIALAAANLVAGDPAIHPHVAEVGVQFRLDPEEAFRAFVTNGLLRLFSESPTPLGSYRFEDLNVSAERL